MPEVNLCKNKHTSESRFLVLCMGAPRSGLNLMTQCLRFLGFKTAGTEPGGAHAIHENLRKGIGISCFAAGDLPEGWLNTMAAENAKQDIRRLLVRHLEFSDRLIVTDAFLARVYPLWHEILAETNIQPLVVQLFRHPLEAARSLSETADLSMPLAHMIWLAYSRDMVRYCRCGRPAQIFFDQLQVDPVGVCLKLFADHDPLMMKDDHSAIAKTRLWDYVKPAFKHHHAGMASEAEKQQFAPFIRVYDNLRLLQLNHGCVKDAWTRAVQHPAGHLADDAFLDVMFQLLGHYEANDDWQSARRRPIGKIPPTLRSCFATLHVPVKKDTYEEQAIPLFLDQWQKITVNIPRPDLLMDMPLRLAPLSTMGMAIISVLEFTPLYSGGDYFFRESEQFRSKPENERERVGRVFLNRGNRTGFSFAAENCAAVKGDAIRLLSKEGLALLILSEKAEVIFSGFGRLPNCRLRLEIWIRTTADLADYKDMLRLLAGMESWQAILGTNPKKTAPSHLIYLAGIFEKSGRLDESDAVFQKAFDTHPESESLRIAYAESAMNQKRWADAICRWQDVIVLMGEKTPEKIYRKLDTAYKNQKRFPLGNPEEETAKGDSGKAEMLSMIHQCLSPALYLEIGVQEGRSFFLANCRSIGVDPMPRVGKLLGDNAQLVKMTSDNFFDDPAGDMLKSPPDLVFIDGMHLFEYVLRDFMNVEKYSSPWTLVVIDDVFPAHPAQSERRRKTRTWTGDVWKLYVVLKKYRSDLFFLPINTTPTGMLLIAGLKKDNHILLNNYGAIVKQYAADASPPVAVLARHGVFSSQNRIIPEVLAILKNARASGTSASKIVSDLAVKVKQAAIEESK